MKSDENSTTGYFSGQQVLIPEKTRQAIGDQISS